MNCKCYILNAYYDQNQGANILCRDCQFMLLVCRLVTESFLEIKNVSNEFAVDIVLYCTVHSTSYQVHTVCRS